MKKTSTTNLRNEVLTLLKNDVTFTEIENSINTIYHYFHETVQTPYFNQSISNLAAVSTSRGKALGMNHAAQCLLDYRRTEKFLKGMVAAIREKQASYPNETIRVFYAGCGPYAPFITLISQLFSPDEIQFDILEINNLSLNHAKKLISGLQLNDYIEEYYLADATTFKFEKDKLYHILFSETLDALLYRECYVPILFNMLPQLPNDISVIPNNVQVIMNLSLTELTNQAHKTEVTETILDVRKVISDNIFTDVIPEKLPCKIINLKKLSIENYNYFSLDTKVNIFNNIWLERNESSLTIPLEMRIEKPFNFSSMIFTYYMTDSIELKYELLE